ncbi:MAG: flagellin [Thermoguttaceae bacterium]
MSGLSVQSISGTLAGLNQVYRTQSNLNQALTQLSTGSRINSGKDDPAGLIASELLRSEITATKAATKNTQMANLMLNVAESGMKQVSNLLIDAKALAVESANTGAMTPQMLSANQVQMDAILNSVNRISGMTNWLGKPLLDGSLSAENGGALFQLGPNVVSSQQVSVPIESTRTTNLGSGGALSLNDLRLGGSASLVSNPGLADQILGAAISQLAMQRGEIGATQKYTLETNVNVLQDSLVQLTGAKSMISDTDFAVASSELMRNQLLQLSGLKALGISNQNRSYASSIIGM